MTATREDTREGRPRRLVIFDHENPLAKLFLLELERRAGGGAVAGIWRGEKQIGGGLLRRFGGGEGKGDGDRGATAATIAGGMNLAVMQLHESPGDGKSEPETSETM